MLSVARSRLALPTQFLFLVVNALGLLLGVVYNSQTPDLYENNAHHKIGWIATWVMSAEVLMGLLFAYGANGQNSSNKHASAPHEREAFLPVSTTGPEDQEQYRWSGDSGQGTERSSSSLQLQYASADRARQMPRHEETRPFAEKPDDDDDEDDETDVDSYRLDSPPLRRGMFKNSAVDKFLTKRVPGLFSNRIIRGLRVLHIIIERTILMLGFIAIATGGVTYGGVFVCSSRTPPRFLPFYSAGTNRTDFSCRKPTLSLVALRISSRAESSSGMACSPWVGGWAVSRILVGLGT